MDPNLNKEDLKAGLKNIGEKLESAALRAEQVIPDRAERLLEEVKESLRAKMNGVERTPLQIALMALAVSLIDQVEPLARQGAENLQQKTRNLIAGLNQQAEQRLDETYERAQDIGNEVQDFIVKHPWKTAAVALAVGLLIGRLASSKKDPQQP